MWVLHRVIYGKPAETAVQARERKMMKREDQKQNKTKILQGDIHEEFILMLLHSVTHDALMPVTGNI